MFTRNQYLEIMEKEQEEHKLNVHWILPPGLEDFNKRFWVNYIYLRPTKWINNEPRHTGPRLYEEDKSQTNPKIVGHFITSDGSGYVLVKGVFDKGGPKIEAWFTVKEYLDRETGKLVFYIMKNGLIYQDRYWWFVELFEEAVGRNFKLDPQVKEEWVPDDIGSMHTD